MSIDPIEKPRDPPSLNPIEDESTTPKPKELSLNYDNRKKYQFKRTDEMSEKRTPIISEIEEPREQHSFKSNLIFIQVT